VVALAEWVADYYLCGIGDAFSAAMPPFSWIESEPAYRLTGEARAGVPDRARDALLALLADGLTIRRSLLEPRAAATAGAGVEEVRRALRGLVREGPSMPSASCGDARSRSRPCRWRWPPSPAWRRSRAATRG